MGEEHKNNNTVSDKDVRISHRNVLWFLYRALAEELILSENAEVMVVNIANLTEK